MRQNKRLSWYLCRAAKAANLLAHQLSGNQRSIGFQVKADIISFLLVAFDELVKVNGVRDNILGLDVLADGAPVRLHIPLSALRPDAQAIALRLARNAPAVAPLGEVIKKHRS